MRPPISPPIHRNPPLLPDAETLAVEALTFLGEDRERLERFLALSGLAIDDLRAISATPAFAESLLDHLCSDERLLVAFAASRGYDPGSIERVRLTLAPPPFED